MRQLLYTLIFVVTIQLALGCPANEQEFLNTILDCPGYVAGESCADASYAFVCASLLVSDCDGTSDKHSEWNAEVVELHSFVLERCTGDDFGCISTKEEFEAFVIDCPEDEDIRNTPVEAWTCDQVKEVMGCMVMTQHSCPRSDATDGMLGRIYSQATSQC